MQKATSPSGSHTDSTARSASTWPTKRCRCTGRARACATFARLSKRNGRVHRPVTLPPRCRRPRRNRRGDPPYNSGVDKRAAAFARLFEAVHEGVYIGTLGSERSSTIAANPHLKLIFGYASDAADGVVCPFDRDRFVDPQARVALLERLASDGSVNDYLLRLRRADGTPV